MSIAEMDRLVSDLPSQGELRHRLGASGGLEEAVGIARSAGYDIGLEEAGVYLERMQNSHRGELSDDQLDTVAGGKGGGNKYQRVMEDAGQDKETQSYFEDMGGLFTGSAWKKL